MDDGMHFQLNCFTSLTPTKVAGNLGVRFDDQQSLPNHVCPPVVQLCTIELYLSQYAHLLLVEAMVSSHLNYSNSLLATSPHAP